MTETTRRSPSERRSLRRILRVIGLLLVSLLAGVIMLSTLQRSFIYFPTRETAIDPDEAGLPTGQVHTIKLRSEDGIDLHGWHVLADGHRASSEEECDHELATGRPLVLYFSGNAGNRVYRPSEFGIITSLGADVFIVDYRGYGDNEGSPAEKLLASDARAVWDYATQERGVAPHRIVLYGESIGGGVAVRLAAELSQDNTPPAALIVRSTFSSLVDAGKYHYPLLPVSLVLIDRYESVKRIPEVTCPYLHVHGARDGIVPMELGQRLFAAAPDRSSSGLAKQFVELPEAGHNDVTFVAAAELQAALRAFFSELE